MSNFQLPSSVKSVFEVQVWELVRQIPPGQVATYGQIAGMIPKPAGMTEKGYFAQGARWVGRAMARCPEGVPWQRVVNARGEISLPPGQGGQEQRQRLEVEGVEFDARGRIDLKRFRWQRAADSDD